MKITVEKLTEWEACEDQVDLFARTFPDGAEITLENLMTAARAGFDITWLANRPFYRPALNAYVEATAPAWKAYEEATAPALNAYVEAKAPAWKAYVEAKASARKAYEEATAPALNAYVGAIASGWKAYEEAIAPARNAYMEAKALAFWGCGVAAGVFEETGE